LTVLVGAGVVGAVVVVVVVVGVGVGVSGGLEVVVLLGIATSGCVAALGGAGVVDATGSIGVELDAVAADTARLLGPATELGDPLDDDVEIDDCGIVGRSALDMPEESALPAVDVSGVVDPLVMAGGALGEPGSSARDTKINTMPKTAAVPIPFCKRLMLTTYLNSLGRLCFARSHSDIS
jgi:hypothetical protein